MIALATVMPDNRPRHTTRVPLEPGERVRLDWPASDLHGARGTVWGPGRDGGLVVVWTWGDLGVSSFLAEFPAWRLVRLPRTGRGG
jgi:hypothetical protein